MSKEDCSFFKTVTKDPFNSIRTSVWFRFLHASQIIQGTIGWTGPENSKIRNCSSFESNLAILEIVVPFSIKHLIVASFLDFRPSLCETLVPHGQRSGIIRSNIDNGLHLQRRILRGSIAQSRERRGASPRKNVKVDKVRARAIRLVSRIGHGDHLNKQQTIWFQKLVASREKCSQVRVANSLQHLNRDNAIILRDGSVYSVIALFLFLFFLSKTNKNQKQVFLTNSNVIK